LLDILFSLLDFTLAVAVAVAVAVADVVLFWNGQRVGIVLYYSCETKKGRTSTNNNKILYYYEPISSMTLGRVVYF